MARISRQSPRLSADGRERAPTEESAAPAAVVAATSVLCFQVISITKSGSVGVKLEIGLPAARLNY